MIYQKLKSPSKVIFSPQAHFKATPRNHPLKQGTPKQVCLPQILLAGRTLLGQQVFLVSQIKIRQCEYHIKFGLLFSQATVSRSSEPEQSLHNSENVLDL